MIAYVCGSRRQPFFIKNNQRNLFNLRIGFTPVILIPACVERIFYLMPIKTLGSLQGPRSFLAGRRPIRASQPPPQVLMTSSRASFDVPVTSTSSSSLLLSNKCSYGNILKCSTHLHIFTYNLPCFLRGRTGGWHLHGGNFGRIKGTVTSTRILPFNLI